MLSRVVSILKDSLQDACSSRGLTITKIMLAGIVCIPAYVPSESDTLQQLAFDSTQANAIARSILKQRLIDCNDK